MTWTIHYTTSAARDIRRLDPGIRKRIQAALMKLSEDPSRGKLLQMGLRGLRSWRTGVFRIVYRVKDEQIEILVVAVGHRRNVYDEIRRKLS